MNFFTTTFLVQALLILSKKKGVLKKNKKPRVGVMFYKSTEIAFKHRDLNYDENIQALRILVIALTFSCYCYYYC